MRTIGLEQFVPTSQRFWKWPPAITSPSETVTACTLPSKPTCQLVPPVGVNRSNRLLKWPAYTEPSLPTVIDTTAEFGECPVQPLWSAPVVSSNAAMDGWPPLAEPAFRKNPPATMSEPTASRPSTRPSTNGSHVESNAPLVRPTAPSQGLAWPSTLWNWPPM